MVELAVTDALNWIEEYADKPTTTRAQIEEKKRELEGKCMRIMGKLAEGDDEEETVSSSGSSRAGTRGGRGGARGRGGRGRGRK